MKNVGYTHPAMVASMVSRHVAPSGDRVLDAGAGTGVLGRDTYRAGVIPILLAWMFPRIKSKFDRRNNSGPYSVFRRAQNSSQGKSIRTVSTSGFTTFFK